ncbi:MAG: inositol monophosphatase [Gemmataceae bacterium]|nr:inositol monophosphatase [Gemmataceae bacterium]
MLLDYQEAAKEAALKAAEVLAYWREKFQVKEKGRADLVTDADVASQKIIREHLLGRFPKHGFLGEEDMSSHGRLPVDAPPTWIVDPIDGTTNYVHDFPFYCISIGLMTEGELTVGVIYDPSKKEMFAAAKGHGAFLNERRIQTTKIDRIEDALLSTGFAPDVRNQNRPFEWWRWFSTRAQSVRRTGSTALNVAYVAAGRFDGYYAFDNHVWDIAAAAAILLEAGGTITNLEGEGYDPFRPDAIATNGPLHPILVDAFRVGP